MLIDPQFVKSIVYPRRIALGLYQTGSWNFELDLSGNWQTYPNLDKFNAFGVCDSPAQFMDVIGKHLMSTFGERAFVVAFVHLRQEDEPQESGWRWSGWGPYIGVQEPQCEYLAHEPVIEEIWTYHVYERG